jgi:mono/diheme cytochrome c family protein
MTTTHRRTKGLLLLFVSASLAAASAARAQPAAGVPADAKALEQGRYIARIAGCNDCHTAGYAPSGGKVPETEWLKGDALGWRGPWGTTNPSNLRLFVQTLTEDQWVRYARAIELRPPMPWFALRDMREDDLRALYRFIRSLGPAGDLAPPYVPPGQTPQGPFVQWPSPPPK